MCGIVGIVHRDAERPVDPAALRTMCDAIRHRGPDDEGTLVSGPVGLGMRRLSIIDLAGGRQPMTNEDGSQVIVFNGEIYNYRELRRELVRRRHRFRTHSDTETIVHLYEEHGPHAVILGPDKKSLYVLHGNHTKPIKTDKTTVPPIWGEDFLTPRLWDASGHAVFDHTIFALRSRFEGTLWSAGTGSRRMRGYSYADTSYSTVPAYKSASLWYRMQAFDGEQGTSAALAILFPPGGSRLPPQGWMYTSRDGKTEVRSTDVKIAFEDMRHEPGGHFEYDVPQRVAAVARGVDGETVTVHVQARKLLYRQDLLDEMGPLSRLLVSTWAAPMAYTYENHYELRIERPGEEPTVRSGQALSEFSYANKPANLPAF